MFIQTLTLQKREPAGRIGDFRNFFNGLAKSPPTSATHLKGQSPGQDFALSLIYYLEIGRTNRQK